MSCATRTRGSRRGEYGGPGQGVVDDLVETMRSFPRCVGIAAPQIGVPARVCIVDCTGHPKVPDAAGLLVLVDPVLRLGDETEIGREGCLSIPDLTADVRRALSVEVEGAGSFTGFEARAIQHEVDHLDGVLFLDRVGLGGRRLPAPAAVTRPTEERRAGHRSPHHGHRVEDRGEGRGQGRGGDTVAILESMKMEMPVEAEDEGIVKEIVVSEGEAVSEGDTLVVLE